KTPPPQACPAQKEPLAPMNGSTRQKLPPRRQGLRQEGFQAPTELVWRQLPDEPGVQEEQAVGVEDGRACTEARGIPLPRELLDAGEVLFASRVRPAQERQVADEGLRQVALATVVGDARRAVA